MMLSGRDWVADMVSGHHRLKSVPLRVAPNIQLYCDLVSNRVHWPLFLECLSAIGGALDRELGFSLTTIESGVALRLPPQSKFKHDLSRTISRRGDS